MERESVGTNQILISSSLHGLTISKSDTGVWLMHCHFDVHLSWGMTMAWIVLDGELPNQKMLPPPFDLPNC